MCIYPSNLSVAKKRDIVMSTTAEKKKSWWEIRAQNWVKGKKGRRVIISGTVYSKEKREKAVKSTEGRRREGRGDVLLMMPLFPAFA